MCLTRAPGRKWCRSHTRASRSVCTSCSHAARNCSLHEWLFAGDDADGQGPLIRSLIRYSMLAPMPIPWAEHSAEAKCANAAPIVSFHKCHQRRPDSYACLPSCLFLDGSHALDLTQARWYAALRTVCVGRETDDSISTDSIDGRPRSLVCSILLWHFEDRAADDI